ncbi:MAG: hypothetical protein ACLROG_16950 [Coprococcus phoceensis]
MEKEECSIDWKSCSTVTFSMGSALSPFCFGFLTFFFLQDGYEEKDYQNQNPKACQGSHRKCRHREYHQTGIR